MTTYEEKRAKLLELLKDLDSKFIYDPLFAELNKIQQERRKVIVSKINSLDKRHELH